MSRRQDNVIICFCWDNGSMYRLSDRETNQWRYPKLVEVITKT